MVPPFGVSTTEAFRWVDEAQAASGARGSGEPAPTGPASARDGINDLEPPVVARNPEIGRLAASLRREGAELAAMSGSGSTVFGLFSTRAGAQAAADRVGRGDCQVLVTRTVSHAEYQRRSMPVLATPAKGRPASGGA